MPRTATRSQSVDACFAEVAAAIREVCGELARMIIRDGEGATKFVTVTVGGAASEADAFEAAMSIANSPLVKTALFGGDANWGRVIMAVGKTKAEVDPAAIECSSPGIPVCRNGEAVPFDERAAAEALAEPEIEIRRRPASRRRRGDGVDVRSVVRVRPHQRRVPKLAASAARHGLSRSSSTSPTDRTRSPAIHRSMKERHMKDLLAKAETLMEALPWIKQTWGRTVVIKYGGAAMTDTALRDSVASDIVLMKLVGINPVIVHGGGPEITGYMDRLGLPVEFYQGLRVTSDEAMEVVKMVLVGKVNKELVASINSHGRLAVGVSGDDANLIMAKQKDERLGRVGDVTKVDTTVVDNLIEDGFIPVVATVAAGEDGGSYNINADLVAGELAAALSADKVIFLTDVDGLYRDFEDKGSLISSAHPRRGRGHDRVRRCSRAGWCRRSPRA